jgi:putative transposase
VRYQFVKQYQGQFSLSTLWRVMEVSRSGFYAFCKRPQSATEQANQVLVCQIQKVFQESKETYGSPRVYEELKELGIAGSEKRIARLMRLADLKAVLPKRFVVTTDSDHDLPIAENLLDREFGCDTPDRRWTADITYVWTSEGWLYLAVLLDLFSRRIIGWSMGTTLQRSLVLSALEMALTYRTPEAGLLCHSDRGSQYASGDYQTALEKAGATCSMSRKGNCWDNAPTESFFASLKKEMVYRTHFASRSEAKAAIFAWIEVWYNRKRRHSSLGYLSPEAFERKHHLEQAAIARGSSLWAEPSRDGSGETYATAA